MRGMKVGQCWDAWMLLGWVDPGMPHLPCEAYDAIVYFISIGLDEVCRDGWGQEVGPGLRGTI